jgi:hypothetical protein
MSSQVERLRENDHLPRSPSILSSPSTGVPIEGYDEMNVGEVVERLDNLSPRYSRRADRPQDKGRFVERVALNNSCGQGFHTLAFLVSSTLPNFRKPHCRKLDLREVTLSAGTPQS